MPTTLGTEPRAQSAITRILFRSARVEMSRIYAQWTVAVVEDPQPVGDGAPIVQLPRIPVCPDIFPSDRELGIFLDDDPKPKPTGTEIAAPRPVLVYISPESHFDCRGLRMSNPRRSSRGRQDAGQTRAMFPAVDLALGLRPECDAAEGTVLQDAPASDRAELRASPLAGVNVRLTAVCARRLKLHQGASSSLVLPAVVSRNRRSYSTNGTLRCR